MSAYEGIESSRAIAASQTDSRRKILRAIVVWFLAAGLVATIAMSASGQAPKYDVKPLHPSYEAEENMGNMKLAAKKIATTTAKPYANENFARLYYSKYLPIKITQPDALPEISGLMADAAKNFASARRAGTHFNSMLNWLYTGLRPVAEGNYHPAARINAILFIANMDERAAGRSGRVRTAPVPMRFIVRDFLPIYKDAKNPDGVRAAALQGIHRFVKLAAPSVKPNEAAELKQLMGNLLNAEPPMGRSSKAHAYLQRFAVDILRGLSKGADPALGQQLISISTETKKPDLIALYSAARIGEMKDDIKGKVNAPDDILGSWAVRAMRSFQYEAIRLQALDRPAPANPQPRKPEELARLATAAPAAGGTLGGEEGMRGPEEMGMGDDMEMGEDMEGMMSTEEMMSMMSDGGGGLSVAAKQPPEVLLSRRKLNFVMQQLHLGATGIAVAGMPEPDAEGGLLAGVGAAEKKAVEAWVTSMDEVLASLNDETLDTRKVYVTALLDQVEVLRGIAGAAANDAEAEAPVEVEGVSPVVAAAKTAEAAAPAAAEPVVEEGVPALPEVDELGE